MVQFTDYVRPWDSYKKIASAFEESMLHPDLIKNLNLFSKLFDQIVYHSIEEKLLVQNEMVGFEDIIETFSGTIATSAEVKSNDIDKVIIKTPEGTYYGFDLDFSKREYYNFSELAKLVGEHEIITKKGTSRDKSIGWFLTKSK